MRARARHCGMPGKREGGRLKRGAVWSGGKAASIYLGGELCVGGVANCYKKGAHSARPRRPGAHARAPGRPRPLAGVARHPFRQLFARTRRHPASRPPPPARPPSTTRQMLRALATSAARGPAPVAAASFINDDPILKNVEMVLLEEP